MAAAGRNPSKLAHRHKNHEPPHKDRDSTPKPAKIRSRLACADDLPAHEMMRLACDHYYCSSCTTRMFNLATCQESSYPPKCCSQISLTAAREHLDRDTRKRYEKKRIEWDTSAKKRVYCSRKNCNTFIPPDSVDRKRASCLECGRNTCLRCKAPEHQGRQCSDNEALKTTLKTLERKGWM
ncbi:hypothetical protein DL95DRAFT_394163 [Leptodontidium sp. 2 PMI_412]|nr:hypothetical protein DL95DRAFT_394163 [Leptodontidium sp. 2 PMI_412]